LRSWPTLANRLRLPRAGVIAELEGVRVAAAIAADVQGGDAPPPFDGSGYCFIAMGHAAAALVDGDGYATPEPRVVIAEPDAAHAARSVFSRPNGSDAGSVHRGTKVSGGVGDASAG
jgi:sulfide:quinone oxidoreductase